MPREVLAFVDDDGEEIVLDDEEATTLLQLTRDLDPATVSACPACRSRVVACVALVDLLEDAPPPARPGAHRARRRRADASSLCAGPGHPLRPRRVARSWVHRVGRSDGRHARRTAGAALISEESSGA